MIIDQLPALSGDVVATDEIPVERGTTTYKTTPDKFLAAMSKDAVPTQGSENAVESGGVYDALQTKQNTLTFDSAPTQGSSNPVESGGVYTAIDGLVSYAEAQTLTTAQQKQARDNIGADWVLVWQNANPTSSFAPQTIMIDLSAYQRIAIVFGLSTLYSYPIPACEYFVGSAQCLAFAVFSGYPEQRSIESITQSSIVFGHGYRYQSYGSGATEMDDQIIPLRIYGIK